MSSSSRQPFPTDRDLLLRLQDAPATGATLAREAGQTRAAMWKRIHALRGSGIGIDARPGTGYALAQPLDLLDAEAIRAAAHAVDGEAATLEVAWSIDSTNSELLRQATPVRGVAILLAEQQTGGRGRRGRAWSSPLAANLYVSFARVFDGGLARLGGLSIVAGVAVAEALRGLGFAEVGLKWPNDLVVRGPGNGDGTLRKLGGILVEGGGEHAGPVRAVVGLGVNVRMPPATAIDQPWTDLATLAWSGAAAPALPSRSAIAAALVAHMLPALESFDAAGLAPFLPRLAACDVLTGRAIDVHAGDGIHRGIACGVAGDGALRVRTGRGERVFHSGEVSVRASGGDA